MNKPDTKYIIKNIIKESLNQVLNTGNRDLYINNIKGESFFETIKKDIKYLSKYKLTDYNVKNEDNSEIWRAERTHDKFKFSVAIKHHFRNNIWHFRIRINGNLQQNGEMSVNTKHGYDEFKLLLNTKLSGNALWRFDSYRNDVDDVQNDEIIKQLKELLDNEDKLSKINNKTFNDLKKVLEVVKKFDLKTQQKNIMDELLKIHDNSKESILMTLLKICNLSYHVDLEKMHGGDINTPLFQ